MTGDDPDDGWEDGRVMGGSRESRVRGAVMDDLGLPHGRTVVVGRSVVRGRWAGWVSTGGGQTTDGGLGGMGEWCQAWGEGMWRSGVEFN